MTITVDANEFAGRFVELAGLVRGGVEVLIREGDVVAQLVPPLPPLAPIREHTFTVYPNGAKVRDDFDAPMELVDSADVREWEALAEWVRPFRPPHTPIPAENSNPTGGA